MTFAKEDVFDTIAISQELPARRCSLSVPCMLIIARGALPGGCFWQFWCLICQEKGTRSPPLLRSMASVAMIRHFQYFCLNIHACGHREPTPCQDYIPLPKERRLTQL